MDTSGSEPSAFDKMLAEHRELRALLVRIEKALQERSASIAEVGDMIGQLADRLIRHFTNEEEGGYFAEALLQAPQLVARANALIAQHPKMCTKARQLVIDLSTAEKAERWWDDTAARFQEFKQELFKHEREEDRLLQEAYTDDLGSKD